MVPLWLFECLSDFTCLTNGNSVVASGIGRFNLERLKI